jgi:DNA-directed RNA polymerase subunit RPC12/RpoP
MPISFACPSCQKNMTVPDQYAGQKARCKGCGHKLIVPTARPAPAPAPASDESPFGAIDSPGAGDEPSPRRRRAGSSGGTVLMGLLFAFCLLPIGAFSLYQRFGNLPNTAVTKANYNRIQEGMTLEQVEAFLGRGSSTRDVYDGAGGRVEGDWIRWNGKKGAIAVRLNNKGRVAAILTTGTLE